MRIAEPGLDGLHLPWVWYGPVQVERHTYQTSKGGWAYGLKLLRNRQRFSNTLDGWWLDELYEVIRRLMDATFQATETEMKVRLAHLKYRARPYRQMIQDRLAINN